MTWIKFAYFFLTLFQLNEANTEKDNNEESNGCDKDGPVTVKELAEEKKAI